MVRNNVISLIKGKKSLMRSFYLVVFLSFSVFSCGDESIKLNFIKSIPKPDFDAGIIDYHYFNAGGIGYLSSWNRPQKRIEIVKMSSGKRVRTVELDFLYTNYHIYDLFHLIPGNDSIFIFADLIHESKSKHLLLLNFNGNLLQEWNMDAIFNNRDDYAIMPTTNKGMLYKDGKAYLQKVFKYYSHGTKRDRKKAYSEPSELIFNLKDIPPTAENEIGNYPEHYFENYYADIYFSRCLNQNNELIYSFQADHDIYVYNLNGGKRQFNAKSNFIESFNHIKEEDLMDMELTKKYYAVEPKYSWIKYDPFRNQYLRLAVHRKNYVNESGTLTNVNDRERSLVILDGEFQRIGEVKFDKKTSTSLVEITKEGLLMSTIDSNGLQLGLYHVGK